jgi:hypothetical protein
MWVVVQLGVESLGGDLVDRRAGATHTGGPPRRDYRRARIVLPEGLHQAVHHEQQNHRERHARGDGCRLQRLQTAREQQHTGDETFTQPPEDAEPLRRMRIAHPGLDQAAVDAEVPARQQPAHLRPVEQPGQELGGDIAREQPVAVLREGRVVPDRIVDARPTNQRNNRSKSSRSISWRSERIE